MTASQGLEDTRDPLAGEGPGGVADDGDGGAQAPYLCAVFSTQAGVGSPDSKELRALFTRKRYDARNALIVADTWFAGKQTDSKHAAALFRVRNTTDEAIDWPVDVFMTGYASLGEPRTIAVNGVQIAADGGNYGASNCEKTAALAMPAGRDSTVIFLAGSGPYYGVSSSLPLSARSLCLGFFNDCLDLPDGLEYVDDLKVASGDYARRGD